MIHRTAVVESGAEVGADVTIGPFSYVESGARIADGCVLGPHVTVLRYTSIGKQCEVHAGAVLGDLPQDTSFANVESFARIGDRCKIREGVTIHRGTKAGTETVVGPDCFLMAFSHVAHNVRLGQGVIVANGALLAGYVEVGDRVFISGNVVVHQFVRIGRLAMVGGEAGLSKDVPPFCTAKPLAPNTILGLNVVGLRRGGVAPAERAELRHAFKLLYQSGLNVSQALERLRASGAGPAVAELCDFVAGSKRGICRASASFGEEDSDS